MKVDSIIEQFQESVQKSFQQSDRVRSFSQFLEVLATKPRLYLRTAPQYMLDMFDWFGTRDAVRIGQEATRYRVFDRDAPKSPEMAGQESVQEEIYKHLLAAAKRGKTETMLLLHGPNGSGKTTIVECLVRGLERYSTIGEGSLVKFNWIFTDEKLGRIGFESDEVVEGEPIDSFAHLKDKEVSAKIPCELRDSPVFLIPKALRKELLEKAIEACPEEERPRFPYDFFLDGELCQKCRRIYDTLLLAYQGDWKKVIRHVQVERFFVSRRFRNSAASIEPQGNVDAAARPIQHEHSWNIPPILRNISLYEPVGDIVDANRGILEYSDFLKRPPEANKYLLTTCERGTVNLSNCIAYLDLFIVGTSNENQLNLFKRSPDFSSFKGRIELVAVPYLLRYSLEESLYSRQIELYSHDRHVTPHAAEVAALWAVLTRLRRPEPKRYEGALRKIVSDLAPLEKARLYDAGKAPNRLTDEDRKVLRSNVIKLRNEFEDLEGEFEGIFGPEYEGRHGASPREMLTVISRAAESKKYRCLTPMAVLEALEELVKDTSLYDFLRLAPDGEYNDVQNFLKIVRNEHLRWVTEEVYNSIDLIDEGEYDRVFFEYFRHIKAAHTGEKVFNPSTDSYESPNEELMNSIEKLLDLKESKEEFHSQTITRIAAWSLDHPQEEINYQDLFNEIYTAMRGNFYRERNRLLTLIEQDILKHGTDEFDLLSKPEKEQVERALNNMKERFNYCDHCARDALAYVLKYRPQADDKPVAKKSGKKEKQEATKMGTKS